MPRLTNLIGSDHYLESNVIRMVLLNSKRYILNSATFVILFNVADINIAVGVCGMIRTTSKVIFTALILCGVTVLTYD